MNYFWAFRLIILVIALLLAIAVLGESAEYVATVPTFDVPGVISVSMPAWAILSIAVSGLTFLYLTPTIIIDIFRRGAFPSWIVTELIALGTLIILWIANTAEATSAANTFWNDLNNIGFPSRTCSALDNLGNDIEEIILEDPELAQELKGVDFSSLGDLCREHSTVQNLSVAVWVILLVYFVILLILTLLSRNRGNKSIWKSTVRDASFLAYLNTTDPSIQMQQPQTYTPSAYTPSGTPMPMADNKAYYPPGPVAGLQQMPQMPAQQQQGYFAGQTPNVGQV